MITRKTKMTGKAVQSVKAIQSTYGTIEVYKDRRNEWRWRLKARNGKIVAESGEGYTRRADCLRILERLAVAQIVG